MLSTTTLLVLLLPLLLLPLGTLLLTISLVLPAEAVNARNVSM